MIAWLCALAFGGDLAVYGDTVHPVAGPPIADGVVVVRDARIVAVGPAASTPVPAGARVVRGAVVTPGFVDALGVVGLSGPENRPPDQDHAEPTAPVQPALRALDGYDGWSELVAWVRRHGVTTVQTGPSPGSPVGGRTLIAHTRTGPVGENALVADGAVVFSLGEAAKSRFGGQGAASRMGGAATVRQALAEARDYRDRRRLPLADRPPVDLGLEALVDLLEGRRTAIFHAHRADDLLTALRIGEEFGLRVVLAGAAEAWRVRDALRKAGVPVLLGPVMGRGWTASETRDQRLDAAALLREAGVPVAFVSGYEAYVPKVRVVPWEAALAASHGLGAEAALSALTLDAARILGLEAEIGALTPGRRADLVVFDGDPFEYVTHVCAVVIDGQVTDEGCPADVTR